MSNSLLSGNSINNLVKAASYAVRGKIVARSAELSKILNNPATAHTLPFKKIISCNIGNPHSLQQKPISFVRDVLSLVINPSLQQVGQFESDVIDRAQKYIHNVSSVGAYSESQGISVVRQEVADFLGERDGVAGNIENIFLTNGASEGVKHTMQILTRDPASGFKDGILTPIPQYPLYSALTTLLQGNLIPYHLDESNNWSCSVDNLRSALNKAKEQGITPRAIVVINPGNPTGQILPVQNMEAIIRFCIDEQIVLLADEVYQENIWKPNTQFNSFRKIAYQLGLVNDTTPLQLISFHSISKGFVGECGLRGGYFELIGVPADVRAEFLKLASISLCSNTIGQIATGLMVRPPKQSEPSFPKYQQEKSAILESMLRRAEKLSAALNKLPNMSCTNIDGAMYAFPTIVLPEKALQEAAQKGVAADEMYCMQLLEETGIVVVPGSGFGQAPGTMHFRTTILPPEETMVDVVAGIETFHRKFIAKYQ